MDSVEDSGIGMAALVDKETLDEVLRPEEDEDDFIDETFTERLWGLAEMFPDDVRRITWNIVTSTCKTIKCMYNCTRSATWIFFSSSVILFAPVILEIERANMEEVQRREQKQILLGPNAAITGGRSPA